MEASTLRARASAEDQTERCLITQAKEYLHRRLLKMAPDAVLTQAWDSFYQIYTGVLRRMAAEFHLAADESDDLVQEVWARVIVNLQAFDWHEHGAGLRGWLYTLTRNQALNLIRRKVRHPLWLASDMEIRAVADPGPGPAEQWQARWDRELMHLLVAEIAKTVSPLNHRLLILRWIEGHSLADVARLLNLSAKQVTYRQQRLFRKLRAAMAVYRGEPFGANSESFSLVG